MENSKNEYLYLVKINDIGRRINFGGIANSSCPTSFIIKESEKSKYEQLIVQNCVQDYEIEKISLEEAEELMSKRNKPKKIRRDIKRENFGISLKIQG